MDINVSNGYDNNSTHFPFFKIYYKYPIDIYGFNLSYCNNRERSDMQL